MNLVFIFYFIILLFSIIIHEVSHGYVAEILGDDTARVMGRLTLNPIVHLDPIGSVILPLFLILMSVITHGPLILFGWAKPVPYNPLNLKDPKLGSFYIALAGPLSNILIAVIFGLLLRFNVVDINANLGLLFALIIFLNLMLAIFNLLPIPPLDGSKVLFGILPDRFYKVEEFFYRYQFILFFIILMFGASIVMPIVNFLFMLITSYPLTI
jgi:Zn-dependent protease